MGSINLIQYEIDALNRYREAAINTVLDHRGVIERVSQCYELLFKSICIRDFRKTPQSPEIDEPVSFLKEEGFFGKRIAYDEKKFNARTGKYETLKKSRYKFFTHQSAVLYEAVEAIRVRANGVKHTSYTATKEDIIGVTAAIRTILKWYFGERYKYELFKLTKDQIAILESIFKDDLDRIKEKYFKYLEIECGRIYFEGIPSSKGSLKIPLEKSFIPIRLVTPEAYNEGFFEIYESKRRRIEELITTEKRLIILANPGAGKSTLLKSIALSCAFPGKGEEIFNGWQHSDVFPIYFKCRDLHEKASWPIADIISYIPKWAGDLENSEVFLSFVSEKLNNSDKVLLLIDGVDEITDDKYRKQFLHHVQKFIELHPHVRIIITSREAGLRIADGWLMSTEDFAYYFICPLVKAEIEELSVKWYTLVDGHSESVIAEAKSIAQEINRSSELKELAENPLLLTALLLVRRKHGFLPIGKEALYSETIKLLLNSWNIEAHGDKELDYEETEIQLACAAYLMTKAGKQGVTDDELRSYIKYAQKFIPRIIDYSPSFFIKSIETRTGLIRVSGDNKYEFVHLSFQEFLTAIAICKKYLPEKDLSMPLSKLLITEVIQRDVHLSVIALLGDLEFEKLFKDVFALAQSATTDEREKIRFLVSLDEKSRDALLETGEWDQTAMVIVEKLMSVLVLARCLHHKNINSEIWNEAIELIMKNCIFGFLDMDYEIKQITRRNENRSLKNDLEQLLLTTDDPELILQLTIFSDQYGFFGDINIEFGDDGFPTYDLQYLFSEVKRMIGSTDKTSQCMGILNLSTDYTLYEPALAGMPEGDNSIEEAHGRIRPHLEEIFAKLLKTVSFEDPHFYCLIAHTILSAKKMVDFYVSPDYLRIYVEGWLKHIITDSNMIFASNYVLCRAIWPTSKLDFVKERPGINELLLQVIESNTRSYRDKLVAAFIGQQIGNEYPLQTLENIYRHNERTYALQLFAEKIGIDLPRTSWRRM